MTQPPEPNATRRRRTFRRRALANGASVLRHPVDRQEGRARGPFDRFAERASFLASSPLFFSVCLTVVAVWAVGLALGASDRFEATAAGLMSATTLVLVALMKNAELRAERAIQQKLDAIASSLLEDKRGDRGDADQQLETAIGLHEEI
jgi:hypothetical protein